MTTNTKNNTRIIAHIDADAFFASCEQALHPKFKNKPIVVGKERGIVTAFSYDAKALGITRGMSVSQIQRQFPQVTIVPADYESYSLFSKRMFSIMKRYSDQVEEYGIDEAFIELTGMRRSIGMSYTKMAYQIKSDIEKELGITVSVGLASTKVLAKAASKWNKPSGFCHIIPKRRNDYLKKLPIAEVWGVGKNTAGYMYQLGIFTAYQFANKSIGFVETHFTKPHQEIWRELNGDATYRLQTEKKQRYVSISKSRTFTPQTNDREFVFSQFVKNLENACIKARNYKLAARKLVVMIKTQDFEITALDVCLSRASAYPTDMVKVARTLFDQLYKPGVTYRSTGVILGNLIEDRAIQATLFEQPLTLTKMKQVYATVDLLSKKFGKHTVHLGASQKAHNYDEANNKNNSWQNKQLFYGRHGQARLRIPILT